MSFFVCLTKPVSFCLVKVSLAVMRCDCIKKCLRIGLMTNDEAQIFFRLQTTSMNNLNCEISIFPSLTSDEDFGSDLTSLLFYLKMMLLFFYKWKLRINFIRPTPNPKIFCNLEHFKRVLCEKRLSSENFLLWKSKSKSLTQLFSYKCQNVGKKQN